MPNLTIMLILCKILAQKPTLKFFFKNQNPLNNNIILVNKHRKKINSVDGGRDNQKFQ